MNHEEIDILFTERDPLPDQIGRHIMLRDFARTFAHLIIDNTSAGREQSAAITALEEVVFWANASIVRGETGDTDTATGDGA